MKMVLWVSTSSTPPTSVGLTWLILILDYFVFPSTSASAWEHLSLRYGVWYRPPRTPREAEAMGYERVNEICTMDTYYGFLWVNPNNDKARLIFDSDDQLAGIQAAIPGNLKGYNQYNDTISVPSQETIPPILLSQQQFSPSVNMYTITAYFKSPRLICRRRTDFGHPGKGLFIQMGYKVEQQVERIPLDARRLDPQWKTGTCLPSMGRHYFKNLTPHMPCESLYPVFLMYNGEGQLGGFGWLFQGDPTESPRSPVKWFKYTKNFYPAIFDESMLPPCSFNPNFRVFGIRIYLRNENTMTCPRPPNVNVDQEDINKIELINKHPDVLHPLDDTKLHHNRSNSQPKSTSYNKNSPNGNIIVDDPTRRNGNIRGGKCRLFNFNSVCVMLVSMYIFKTMFVHILTGHNVEYTQFISSR